MAIRAISLGQQLAALLRGRIVRGQIQPGTHLVEKQLADENQISRGPVRDALRVLQNEGLIESRRRGLYSKAFTQQDVTELYELRTANELLAGRLAIEASNIHAWKALDSHLIKMRLSAKENDGDSYAAMDLEFHSQFFDLSQNSRLSALWHQYEPTFATLLEITNAQDADLMPSYKDHVELLRLAKEQDFAAFAKRLEAHLEGSRRRLSAAVPN